MRLSRLLGKLDTQDQMSVSVTIHLLARNSRIGALDKADESESLCFARLSVLGQEDTGDAAETLEHGAEVVFFGEFGDL